MTLHENTFLMIAEPVAAFSFEQALRRLHPYLYFKGEQREGSTERNKERIRPPLIHEEKYRSGARRPSGDRSHERAAARSFGDKEQHRGPPERRHPPTFSRSPATQHIPSSL